MLQKSRFSISDLQGFRRTQESLDRLLIRKDYRLGEPTLAQKAVNPNVTASKNKEAMLAQACADLKIDNTIYEFKSINPALDKVALEAMNDQQHLIDILLALKVYRKISNQLKEEAAALFAFEDKMKSFKDAVASLLRQEQNETYVRNLNESADSKRQLEAQLFALRSEIHAQSMKTLDNILQQINHLSAQYADIQDMRIKNKARHNENIKNAMDNFEIDGKKVFTPEVQKEIISLLEEKNQVANRIDALDQEIAMHEGSLSNDEARLNAVQKELLESNIADVERKDMTNQQNKDLDEYINITAESAAVSAEENICLGEINIISDERVKLKKSLSEDNLKAADTSSQKHAAAEKPEKIQKRIEHLDKKEADLIQKMQDLKAQKARLDQKQNDMIASILSTNSVIKTHLVNKPAAAKLKAEEKELKKRIERTKQRLQEVKEERSALSETFNHIVKKIDDAYDKTIGFIKNIFSHSEDEAAKAAQAADQVKAIQAAVEKEAEASRQEDNAAAAAAADCQQQMESLAEQANAVLAVGASCGAQLGFISPHSQHANKVAQMDEKENAKVAQIHSAVGVALGAGIGASAFLRANA